MSEHLTVVDHPLGPAQICLSCATKGTPKPCYSASFCAKLHSFWPMR